MINSSQSDQMSFEPILAKQGDILLIDAFVPHGSGDNTSDRPRRCLVFSFNRLDDGNFNKGLNNVKMAPETSGFFNRFLLFLMQHNKCLIF